VGKGRGGKGARGEGRNVSSYLHERGKKGTKKGTEKKKEHMKDPLSTYSLLSTGGESKAA